MTTVRRFRVWVAAFAGCLLVLSLAAGAAAAKTDYRSLSFVDRSHGWAAAFAGDSDSNVRRTSDGGKTWGPIDSRPLAGAGVAWVTFVTQDVGVWDHGALEYTTDGGDTWNPAATVGGIYNDAAFATTAVGWAAWSNGTSESGGGIAKTDDGGATWTVQFKKTQPDGSGGFSRVSAPTTRRCYVLKWGRAGGIYATADGGAKWARRTLPRYADRYRYYLDIDFPAAKVGWAVGDSGRIVRTGNAGATWSKQRSASSARLTAVDFVDTKVGYVVGKGGRVLRTSDGGRHWTRLATGTSKGLNAVCFVDRTHGWVAGSSGALLRTSNGGKTWYGQH